MRAQVVAEYAAAIESMNTSNPGLIKSIHGGGGKGTAHLDDPSDKEQVLAAIDKVFNEMNRSDGIYFEQKVNTKGDGRFFKRPQHLSLVSHLLGKVQFPKIN